MNDWQTLSSLWNWASPVWFVAAAILVAYVIVFRAAIGRRLWLLVAGLAILVFCFVSPLGALANGYLFSAHIVQHLLLLLVVPMCLLLSVPKQQANSYTSSRIGRILTVPAVGWLCGLGTMWFWHVPTLCNASTLNPWIGGLRDTSFLLAGLAFWWAIYAPVERQRLAAPQAVVYLFSACLGCTLLGIYITFATISVCPAFTNPVDRLGVLTMLHRVGFTPSADQHLGGLLMWIPPCTLYVIAIISILCRWYSETSPYVPVPHSQHTTASESTP